MPATPGPLTEIDKTILAMERRRWRYAGAKEQAIRDEVDLSATAYYARLADLLDDPAALAHDPQTVRRLQRLRDARRAARPARREGWAHAPGG